MHIGDFGVVVREVEASAELDPKAAEAAKANLDTFMFYGVKIHLRGFIGAYPMMRFATLIYSSAFVTEPQTLAVLNGVLEGCIHPDDWAKFQALADTNQADLPTVQKLTERLYQVWSARPTARPSDSSDGPLTDEPGTDSSEKSSDSSPASNSADSSNRQELVAATG